MYDQSARYYDEIYLSMKNFDRETELLEKVIARHLRSGGTRLLDVACGPGQHLQRFQKNFQIEGLDINPEMLKIARAFAGYAPAYG